MKMDWGVEIQLHGYLTLELDGGEVKFHTPAALYLGKNPGIQCTEGWVGPKASPDTVAKIKIHSLPLPGTEIQLSSP
jgi:hypothetical protein